MGTIVDDIDFYEIPVKALRTDTKCKLSCMLNRPKVLMSPKKLLRDYRGLGDLMHVEILSHWFPDDDYVPKLLYYWEKERPEEANLGTLHEFFGLIDRYDVLDDTFDLFVDDAKEYRRRNCKTVVPYESDVSCIGSDSLTVDDVCRIKNGEEFQIYDAFVLYVDADREFAHNLITTMESKPYNLHLCDKDRDLVGGIEIERSAIIKLITDRCRKLLVILSTEFLQSALNTSFVQFAQSLSYKERSLMKVIPCIYKECNLPDDIRAYHVLDYRRCHGIVNFWEKLYHSLVPLVGNGNSGGPIQMMTLRAIEDKVSTESQLAYPVKMDSNLNFEHQSISLPSVPNGQIKNQLAGESTSTTSPKKMFCNKIIKFFKMKKEKKRSKTPSSVAM